MSPAGGGSLAGLTPEQIATTLQVENQAENLRQQSVSSIIQGADVESQIAYRQATGELNRAQADSLRAEQPHIAQRRLAEIDANRALTAERQQQTLSNRTLLPEQVAAQRANVRQSDAAARSSDALTRQRTEMLAYEKRQADANIEQSLAAAGYSRANAARVATTAPKEAELLQNQIDEYVTMQLKTGPDSEQTFKMKGPALLDDITKTRQQMITNYKEAERLKREARKDAQTALTASTRAEQNILAKKPGGYKIEKDEGELATDADMFHATSQKPYVYILESEPGNIYGSTPRMKKRDLPTVGGHSYTAQEIYDKAEARSMTVQQYMEQVFYPKLQQPVPWKTAVTSIPKTTQ